MDSVGKRKSKELSPDENPQKKTRRKSCLAKKTVNVQRDPTEPVVKTKKSRVSFAPKECHVKGFIFSVLKFDINYLFQSSAHTILLKIVR